MKNHKYMYFLLDIFHVIVDHCHRLALNYHAIPNRIYPIDIESLRTYDRFCDRIINGIISSKN